MKNSELPSCPRCGGKARMMDEMMTWFVRCSECHGEAPWKMFQRTEEAVERWVQWDGAVYLNPCPLCKKREGKLEKLKFFDWQVHCIKCGWSAPSQHHSDTAIHAWNHPPKRRKRKRK